MSILLSSLACFGQRLRPNSLEIVEWFSPRVKPRGTLTSPVTRNTNKKVLAATSRVSKKTYTDSVSCCMCMTQRSRNGNPWSLRSSTFKVPCLLSIGGGQEAKVVIANGGTTATVGCAMRDYRHELGAESNTQRLRPRTAAPQRKGVKKTGSTHGRVRGQQARERAGPGQALPWLGWLGWPAACTRT